MKLHFDNVDLTSSSGPNGFAKQLIIGLLNKGIEITDKGPDADVSVVFIEPSGQLLASKVVHRLDGIWTKPAEFDARNVTIKRQYMMADVVVFQSGFDQRFIEHHWGSRKNSVIIHNGINANAVTTFTSPQLLQLRQEYEKVFVCSANWHPQKRLSANISLFFHLRKLLGVKCCLIVLGANPDKLIADPHVFYAGSVTSNVYMEIYAMADWMLHLAWRDHCPNTVVQCLSQATPVLCSQDGGTIELVQQYGHSLNESVVNNNDLFDYDNPPIIDVEQVKSLPILEKTLCPSMSMNKCVDSYIDACFMASHR